jgi:putative FmdB family regulatory protein
MPFYEYECSRCGHHEEVLQKIGDTPLKKCPKCGKNALKKLVSAPVFRLKGSGWYETDFKSDKENKRNLAGADKEESKPDAKSETKADAKPEAKAESKPEPKSESSKPEPAKATKKLKSKTKPKAPAPKKASRR